MGSRVVAFCPVSTHPVGNASLWKRRDKRGWWLACFCSWQCCLPFFSVPCLEDPRPAPSKHAVVSSTGGSEEEQTCISCGQSRPCHLPDQTKPDYIINSDKCERQRFRHQPAIFCLKEASAALDLGPNPPSGLKFHVLLELSLERCPAVDMHTQPPPLLLYPCHPFSAYGGQRTGGFQARRTIPRAAGRPGGNGCGRT